MFGIIISFFTNIKWTWLKNIFNLIKGIKWTTLKISIILNVALIVVAVFLLKSQEKVAPEIIIKDKVIMIPAKVGIMDTVYRPTQIMKSVENPINQKLLKQYDSLVDSIAKRGFVEKAITEREYNEVYEDSLVKINIYSKVIGTMLKQAPNYVIKPSRIIVKDTTIISYSKPIKSKLLGGVEIGVPIRGDRIALKGSLYLQNKKHNMLSIGFDSNETVWFGYIIKF